MIKIVNADESKVGEVIAENIVDTENSILLAKNTILNPYLIRILNRLGYNMIKVYADRKKARKVHSVIHRLTVMDSATEIDWSLQKLSEYLKKIGFDEGINCDLSELMIQLRVYDEYTFFHSVRVAIYSLMLGTWIELEKEEIFELVMAALLHDFGKLKIPLDILNKKGRLTIDEYELIKKHPFYGYDQIKCTGKYSAKCCDTILLHHERLDGTGYPHGYTGQENINLFSRIVAITDVYDAMISDRPYKKRTTPFDVFTMFHTVGEGKFDKHLLDVFMQNISAHFVGHRVILDTEETGEIVYLPLESITRPVISINREYVDLSKRKDKKILAFL